MWGYEELEVKASEQVYYITVGQGWHLVGRGGIWLADYGCHKRDDLLPVSESLGVRLGSGSLTAELSTRARGVSHSLGSIRSMKGRRAPTAASRLIHDGISLPHKICRLWTMHRLEYSIQKKGMIGNLAS